MKKLMTQPKTYLSYVVFGIVVAVALVPVMAIGSLFAPGPLGESRTLVIAFGENTRAIAGQLEDNGVIYNGLAFRVGSKLLASGLLKAGEYQFNPGQSAASILQMMHNGQSIVHWFKIAEGLTSAEIVTALNNTLALSGDVTDIPAEGSLFPENYRFSFGDTRASIINRMQKAMQENLAAAWAGRDADLPLKSMADALVMASVIEKETGKPDERSRVAGVFYNRLAQSMRLQSDPTVIYALTRGRGPLNRELTHEDMAVVSPYNTYTSDGLPPTPICNPGLASILAALHPEHHNFIYFVADGSGGHAFAHDLAEHNQNINKWMKKLGTAPPAPAAPSPASR